MSTTQCARVIVSIQPDDAGRRTMKKIGMLLLTVILSAALAGCAGSRSFQRGEKYAGHGEWDLAVKEYREANSREPKSIEYRSALLRAEETAANHHYKRARIGRTHILTPL